jgi:glycosyltransferase involved in cell wall biosynthesis
MSLEELQQPAGIAERPRPVTGGLSPVPRVSVAICAYTMERFHDICEAVDSVLAQTEKPDEIVVSIDHNEELLQKLKAELPSEVKFVLNQGTIGSAETRNTAIRFSDGDIVAFIDDDAIAEKNWLRNLKEHYRDPSVMAVGGRLNSVWRDGRPRWFPEELDWVVGGTYKGHPEGRTHVRNLIAANMSFRSKVCDHIGFILTDLGALGKTARAGDETEFCMRIGHHIPDAIILYEPDAIVYHKASPREATLKHLIARSFNEGRYKGKSTRIYSALSQNPLSTESAYLRYLLSTAIPQRIRSFYKKSSIVHLGAIILSIAVVGAGYLVGKASQTT